jgi:hypothetical protein
VASVFNPAGRVALIASAASGSAANGIGIGAARARLRRRATRQASGLWEGPKLTGGARDVYGVRSGHVRYIAIAAPSELRSIVRLRSDLRAAGM